MKTFTIDIHPLLQNVTFTVKNGRAFAADLISGHYRTYPIEIAEWDIKRVKRFAVRAGNDKSSCHGHWYAHCNGYAMDLAVLQAGNYITINTYRPFGKSNRED